MDPIPQVRVPARRDDVEDVARALEEIDAAIELVSRGLAARVRLCGLVDAADLLGTALAHAQAAGVGFHVDRAGTVPTLTIGPRH